jgi:hypothetical protein
LPALTFTSKARPQSFLHRDHEAHLPLERVAADEIAADGLFHLAHQPSHVTTQRFGVLLTARPGRADETLDHLLDTTRADLSFAIGRDGEALVGNEKLGRVFRTDRITGWIACQFRRASPVGDHGDALLAGNTYSYRQFRRRSM